MLGGLFGGPAGALAGAGAGVAKSSVGMLSVPGTPGLDRTPILASGGEMILSHRNANMLREALSMSQVGPEFERLESPTRSARVNNIELQVTRPFRRTEQIDLVKSVEESTTRTRRYRP